MIIRKIDAKTRELTNCHDGRGVLHCTEMLTDYRKPGAGFTFIHDNIIEPGASIGEHRHDTNEETYIILEGHGTMKVDGVDQTVGPGDICITRSGHRHALTNSADGPMHMLVVATNL